jgi:hypothetical protein
MGLAPKWERPRVVLAGAQTRHISTIDTGDSFGEWVGGRSIATEAFAAHL